MSYKKTGKNDENDTIERSIQNVYFRQAGLENVKQIKQEKSRKRTQLNVVSKMCIEKNTAKQDWGCQMESRGRRWKKNY